MIGTEVNTSSAWAERALAVLLLPFAFLVMVGGGAGLMWLWQDYRAQFWIGICAVAVLGLLASTGMSVAGRQHRRLRWLSRRPAGEQPVRSAPGSRGSAASEGDSHDLLLELLSRVEDVQQDLDVLMGEFTTEQERARSGRHAGHTSERRSAAAQQLGSADPGPATLPRDVDPPMMVDIRDDADGLDLGDDGNYDYLFGDDEDFDDDSAGDHQELGLIHTPDPQDEHPDDAEPGDVAVPSESAVPEVVSASGAPEADGADDADPAIGEAEPSDPDSSAEPVRAESVRSEPVRSEPVHAESGDAEIQAAEIQAAESGHIDPEAADSEAAESADAKSADAESEDSGLGHAEPGDGGLTKAAFTDAESDHAEFTDPEPAKPTTAEPANAENPSAENTDAEKASADRTSAEDPDAGFDAADVDGPEPDQRAQAQRLPRRLVRERRSRQQWDAIPAPRDPVQVIDLPREEFGAASIQAGLAAGLLGSQPASHGPDPDDDDDSDFFGADLGSPDEYRESHQGSHREEVRDESRSIILGEDDDERPRDAR